MGKVLAIASACALNVCGTYVFRTPVNLECIPYPSYLLFLVAVFYLLWNIPLNPYPSCFRGLIKPFSLVIEFMVSVLLVEVLMADFWCPLHMKFVAFIPTIPDHVRDLMMSIDVDSYYVTNGLDVLKSESALVASSYALSVFLLLCMLHSCRALDFRLLKSGVGAFAADVNKRTMRFLKSIVPFLPPSNEARGFGRSWKRDSDSDFSDIM
ncbi:hypothetical protein PPYR_08361 [Photinus pyralis]|uniref:Uncharacterized protein n=1 Tax=Photinus pyralis TaxID=7054 RepID=A0A5N4AJ59_PHOPY|nr:uncharacterized protein LOC116170503 [Photinus pyralis]KAB0797367.1 hypothetical protein PPYR_08361 [Photinus pyralis]